MSRRACWFGALVCVIALTGCASTLVKDYRREANSICAAADKRLGDTPKPSSPAEATKEAKREIAIRGEALAELDELVVPMKVEGATHVIEDLETRQERAHEVVKAAEHKDEAKLRKLEEEAAHERELEADRARAVGLDACAPL